MERPVSEALTPVEPVSPAAAYVGGKRLLARRLVARIEAIPHATYAEPFVGMGGVFLRRRRRPKAEVINDAAADVATLFRILQRHYPQFIETLRFGITTRAEFERLSKTDPTTLTDLERAARFLYLQRTAFGGKVAGRSFGTSRGRSGRFNLSELEPMLADLHERLAGVVIERLDWAEFITRYDRADTLFYVDPPYLGSERYYDATLFGRDDHARLAHRLHRIKGRFILTLNDTPEVRALYEGCRIEEAAVRYSVSRARAGRPKAGELIIEG